LSLLKFLIIIQLYQPLNSIADKHSNERVDQKTKKEIAFLYLQHLQNQCVCDYVHVVTNNQYLTMPIYPHNL
jgi:hypothetical protein